MKHLQILMCLLCLGLPAFSQSFDDLSFGTDSTFEVATWNIEWFPKNGQVTVNYVIDIIEALDIDLLAIQEVDEINDFEQLVDSLDAYDGYLESSWFAGLAYIYKTEVMQIDTIYQIYTTSQYWSPFPRAPMVMDLTFMDQRIIIINNHFKCCGDGVMDSGDDSDEETRRYIASNLLKDYIDIYFPDENVIILGDLNDILSDTPANNAFQMILDDTDNYLFADYDIAMGNNSEWSYPTWPSHLDHIIITNELFDEFENESSTISTIKIDEYLTGGWWEYDNNISDHRPVALKLDMNSSLSISAYDQLEISTSSLLPGQDLQLSSLMPYSEGLELITVINDIEGVNIDSIQLFDDGEHEDADAGDSLFSNIWTTALNEERHHIVDLNVRGEDFDVSFEAAAWFTSVGPLSLDSIEWMSPVDGILYPGDRMTFKLGLSNLGSTASAEDLSAQLIYDDPWLGVYAWVQTIPDIPAGELRMANTFVIIVIASDSPMGRDIPFEYRISSGDYVFWSQEFVIHIHNPLEVVEERPLPENYVLEQNYPNPFNPTTTIRYGLPVDGNVSLVIYDIRGNVVNTMDAGAKQAGWYNYTWNGIDESGQPVSTGLYLTRLHTGSNTKTIKMLYLK